MLIERPCSGCGRILGPFEMYFLPGLDIIDPSGFSYNSGQNYCHACFQKRTNPILPEDSVAKISELNPEMESVNVIGKIMFKSEPKLIKKGNRELKISDAILQDDSGTIPLSLWNDSIDLMQKGNTIKICNAYVTEFMGKEKLTFVRRKGQVQGYFTILDEKR